MNRTATWLGVLLACAAGAGCGERTTPPRDAAAAAPNRAAQAAPTLPTPPAAAPAPRLAPGPRPAMKPGVISLEGFEEPFTLFLFRTPAGFPIAFDTYVPADMLTETVPSAVSFVADFGGKRNDAVALRFLALPAGTTEAGARAAARREAGEEGGAARDEGSPRRFVWSLEELPFTRAVLASTREGLVALGRHGGRYFLVVMQYPDDYADGFVPRANRILEELRWADGTSLDTR